MTRPRTPQADLVALARDAYARRAAIRRRLAHTNTDLRALMLDLPALNADLGNMTVRAVLLALPSLGPERVARVLTDAGVPPGLRMRALSRAQALALADILDVA